MSSEIAERPRRWKQSFPMVAVMAAHPAQGPLPWRRSVHLQNTLSQIRQRIGIRLILGIQGRNQPVKPELIGNVMYFVVFCNLINVLDVGADSSDAVKITVKL